MANNRELSQFGAFLEVNSTNSKVGILTDVGIGTSNPLHKLDINGELGVSPNTAGKSTHVFTTNATDDGRYLLKSNTTTKVDIQANGSSYFNGGNVGFGISTPEQKIHVDGTILATQLSTGASGTGINVTTDSITGPATITIDPAAVGDDTGTVQIKGNLTVQGTTTTINSSTVTFNQISLGDNEKIQIGDSNDLEIYHDGTTNRTIIDDSSGGLKIQSDGNISFTKGGTENLANFEVDGAVKLYYNNLLKFETTSTGVTVTGTVVADGISLGDNDSINVGDSSDIRIYHDGTDSYIKAQGTGENLRVFTVSGSISLQKGASAEENMLIATADGSVDLYYNNSKKFETTSTGATVTGTLVADGVSLGDSEYLYLGAGNDLQLYHTGTNSYIDDTATGNLNIRSNGSYITLGTISGETMISAKTDGNVELFYDNNKKIETTTSGVTVTGLINMNSVAVTETATATVASTSATEIESFAIATYRSAKFHIQITQGTNYQTSEVLVIHDGTTADIIEYGSIATNDYLGTFSAVVTGGNVSLRVTMNSSTSASVKILTNLIAV